MELSYYTPPKQNRNPATGRFVPGHKPWNKNKKTDNPSIGGNTKFKQGHEPHNTKYDGCISIRHHKKDNKSYKYIRVSKGKWVLLQRWVWEQHYGKIPKAWVIRFRDGDTLNCDISNLECVSRAANMELNRNYEKAAQSMKKVWDRTRLRYKYCMAPVNGHGLRAEKGLINLKLNTKH